MNPNFLEEKPKILFEIFLKDYGALFDIDFNKARTCLKNKSVFEKLTKEWYDSQDFKVYDDDYYFLDLFDCYVTYSRKYLRSVLKCKLNMNSFVDLGCGLAYSTSALKQMFPDAKGYATNLKNTKQWKFCQVMAKRMDFEMVESVNEINHNVDFAFASEYFEHIENPIEHLHDVIEAVYPRVFVIANSFNTKSIGHFTDYRHNHDQINESKISRLFNQSLKDNSYIKSDFKFWNNRPQIWVKNES